MRFQRRESLLSPGVGGVKEGFVQKIVNFAIKKVGDICLCMHGEMYSTKTTSREVVNKVMEVGNHIM